MSIISKLLARVMPILVALGILVVFILGFILFSYIIIILGVIAVIVFIIAYIRSKMFIHQLKQKQKKTSHKSGRIIEHNDHDAT